MSDGDSGLLVEWWPGAAVDSLARYDGNAIDGVLKLLERVLHNSVAQQPVIFRHSWSELVGEDVNGVILLEVDLEVIGQKLNGSEVIATSFGSFGKVGEVSE